MLGASLRIAEPNRSCYRLDRLCALFNPRLGGLHPQALDCLGSGLPSESATELA
jgi:hypothetical protein